MLGADSANFSKCDTLAVITSAPDAAWTDLPLNTKRPYKYYRVKAPSADPHVHLAELQFLTRKANGYANTIFPTPLDGGPAKDDAMWCRLMDEPLDKCSWKAEYDNNVQTAPDAWPDVTLRLEQPQRVELLRFVVKHADNGIVPGDEYCLSKWGASGWEPLWTKVAATDSIDAGLLDVGGCYWLANLSKGREELPFIVNADGTVRFPHDWIVRDVEQGRR